MKKLVSSFGVLLLFCFFSLPVRAIDLHYDTGKTYGTTSQHVVIEIPAGESSSNAQSIYALFAASRPFLKLNKPSPSFPNSPVFSTYDSLAGGWYLTLPPDSSADDVLSAFTSRTGHPVVAEITPYDAAYIASLHGRFPQVRIHSAQYLFWPRSDAKNAFTQTPPPTLEAVSIRLEETDQSNLFGTFKTMFDTMFDASCDVAGGSGIKMNYPSDAKLSLSDIHPRWSEDSKNTAFRLGVAGGAVVTYLQTRDKAGKAPITYIGLGQYDSMTANGRAVAARFAKFISLNPNIIWPMAIAGNGDPYDNTFFQESNSKPIVGVIGVVQGNPEGVIVNTSDQSVPVSLPGNPGTAAYSSLRGVYQFSSSIEMSPAETIIFGTYSTNINASSPPPAVPTVQPTLQPTTVVPSTAVAPTIPVSASQFPTAAPQTSPPTPTIQYFPIGGFQITPVPNPTSRTTADQSLARLKAGLRLFVIKTNPLLQTAGNAVLSIQRYDGLVESYINNTLARLITFFTRR